MCINKIKHNAKSAFLSVKLTTQLLFKTKFPKTRITYMRHVDNPQRWSANVGSKLNKFTQVRAKKQDWNKVFSISCEIQESNLYIFPLRTEKGGRNCE